MCSSEIVIVGVSYSAACTKYLPSTYPTRPPIQATSASMLAFKLVPVSTTPSQWYLSCVPPASSVTCSSQMSATLAIEVRSMASLSSPSP